jgi:hypothetical protein
LGDVVVIVSILIITIIGWRFLPVYVESMLIVITAETLTQFGSSTTGVRGKLFSTIFAIPISNTT